MATIVTREPYFEHTARKHIGQQGDPENIEEELVEATRDVEAEMDVEEN